MTLFESLPLLKDIPEGDWVMVAPDGTRVLAHGPDLAVVVKEAPEGIVMRKCSESLFLWQAA